MQPTMRSKQMQIFSSPLVPFSRSKEQKLYAYARIIYTTNLRIFDYYDGFHKHVIIYSVAPESEYWFQNQINSPLNYFDKDRKIFSVRLRRCISRIEHVHHA